MTRYLEITRDDVLQAIKKEPLVANQWTSGDENQCRYCAIGATIANKGLTNEMDISVACRQVTSSVCCDSDSLPKALGEKAWLSAISIKFEQLAVKRADQLNNCTLDYPRRCVEDLSADELAEVKPQLVEWILDKIPDGTIYQGRVL